MTAVSLFTGIGGLDIAATAAGFQVVAMCEREPFCQRVLRHHFPDAELFDDVLTFPAERFVGATILFGGFPCQDISAAGKGAGLEGARSGLWFAMLNVIRRTRPRFVVAENVPALYSRGIDRVLMGLGEAGYAAEPFVVAAEDVGAPHRRERVFIVGELADSGTRGQRAGELGLLRRQPDIAWSGRGLADAPSEQGRGRVLRGLPAYVAAGGELVNTDAAGREQLRGAEPGGEFLAPAERAGWRRCTESRVGGDAHGLSTWVDRCTRHRWPARPGEAQHDYEPPRLTTRTGRGTDRAARLKALGNAVVPAQAYPIFAALAQRIRIDAEGSTVAP